MLRCDELLGYQCLRHLNCKVYGYCGTELFSFIFLQVKTVKISNISLSASLRDIQEFFCFSGDIDYVEMQSDSENSQLAYVTFRDSQGVETAMPLTGATIVDLSVNVTPVEKYKLPPEAYRHKLVSSTISLFCLQ
ncbi:unnamed protein product [Musa acuminata var. zebrina]